MTEAEAEAEAKRRNTELGAMGEQSAYWVSVELPNGEWSVERREERKSLAKRVWEAFLNSPGP